MTNRKGAAGNSRTGSKASAAGAPCEKTEAGRVNSVAFVFFLCDGIALVARLHCAGLGAEMKWLIAALIGALSGWLIASVTNEVAIAMASGAAIGILATIALFGTHPVSSVLKVAGAMAIGSLAGWLVAYLVNALAVAMAVGAAVGVLATFAVADTRPVRSLVKVVGAMAVGFVIGWGIGEALGDHKLGMALAVPLSLLLLMFMADARAEKRRRPF
ncbi:MAG: hypothetical protein KGJ79_18735 [Alphaproteobacteria bacterium]|nr:hypothetical protein [Alphaproteobacteria bacterium]